MLLPSSPEKTATFRCNISNSAEPHDVGMTGIGSFYRIKTFYKKEKSEYFGEDKIHVHEYFNRARIDKVRSDALSQVKCRNVFSFFLTQALFVFGVRHGTEWSAVPISSFFTTKDTKTTKVSFFLWTLNSEL